MNHNFLEFIKKDIETKKTLIATMPTTTKTNLKKYNEKLQTMIEKYQEYQNVTRSYILAKNKALQIKKEPFDISKHYQEVEDLEEVRFLLNPMNTYFEKMGFDTLLYQLRNYYTFNFSSLNDIINGFLDKFEAAGIVLDSEDFNYTCYVHEYMSSFLDVRYRKLKSYSRVSEIFEQIYWANPEIIGHIELNFRKLIRKNAKKFSLYISKRQKEVTERNRIHSYSECLDKLQDAYLDLNQVKSEDVYDIIELAKNGEIDIDQYLENSKVRTSAFESLFPNKIGFEVEEEKKLSLALEKLKNNLEEYNAYVEFKPLFDHFKEEYGNYLTGTVAPKNPKNTGRRPEIVGSRAIEAQILKREDELDRLNRNIFGKRQGLFGAKSFTDIKRLKTDSVYLAKELYELYKKYDEEYYKEKVQRVLDKTMCVSDLLNLYYSFDQFKKLEIQKVYNITDYNDIISYSERFDSFAKNPMNIIVTGISVFDEVPIQKIIVNKYRLNNINIVEGDLNPENVNVLLNKILLIIRVWKIEHGSTTIDKIWFMVNVDQLIKKERVKKS